MSPEQQLVPVDLDSRAVEIERQVAEARAQAEALDVTNDESAAQATAVTREIQRRRKAAEAERKELTGPLVETKRKIDQRFKDAMAPFEEADKIVRGKLQRYTAEVEERRRVEEARLRKEQEGREAAIKAERERQEQEVRKKREQAEREAREAEEEAQKAKDAEDAEAAAALAQEAREAAQAAATAESAIASLPEVVLPQAAVPAAKKPEGISTRKRWTVKEIDASKLPPEFLIPDERAINAAMRAGVKEHGAPPEIPGVEFGQVDEFAVRA